MAKWTILYVTILSVIELSIAVCPGNEVLRIGNLTCKEKKGILKKHNDLRSKVAIGNQSGLSPAVNMLQLTWDDELAAKAQKWAENCKFEHDSGKDRKVARFQVGQNMGITWDSPKPPKNRDKPDFNYPIQGWYDEVKAYKGRYTPEARHFTQVIWGNTHLIGCGYMYYKQPGNKYTKLYVCNYGPSGNYMNQYPYTKGQTGCSSTLTKSPKFPGLCKVKEFEKLQC